MESLWKWLSRKASDMITHMSWCLLEFFALSCIFSGLPSISSHAWMLDRNYKLTWKYMQDLMALAPFLSSSHSFPPSIHPFMCVFMCWSLGMEREAGSAATWVSLVWDIVKVWPNYNIIFSLPESVDLGWRCWIDCFTCACMCSCWIFSFLTDWYSYCWVEAKQSR